MISPSDNNIEELQSNALVSSVTVSSSSTSSGANIGKRKMKTSCMRTRGGSGGNAIGQGAYIRQRKLKFSGNLIQSKKFYCQEHSTAASIPSIISLHSAQDGPSNYSSYDSTFRLTQYYSSRKESSEEFAISSEISSHESFENLALHPTQSTIKKVGNKNQRPNQGYHSHRIRGRGPRVTNTNTTNSVHSGR